MTRQERQRLIRRKTAKIKAKQCLGLADTEISQGRYYSGALLQTWAAHYFTMSIPEDAVWEGQTFEGKLFTGDFS